MATSSMSVLIAWLVVFAMVAPNLQPSSAVTSKLIEGGAAAAYLQEAAGAGAGGVTRTAADQQPPTTGGGSQPSECRTLLQGMLPCGGFLSNPRVYAPDRACCAGFNAVFQFDTITCMCHVVNGDINQLLPAPMQRARLVRLFPACGHNVPVDRFVAACRTVVVPPIDASPVPDLPPPPPSGPNDPPPPPSPLPY